MKLILTICIVMIWMLICFTLAYTMSRGAFPWERWRIKKLKDIADSCREEYLVAEENNARLRAELTLLQKDYKRYYRLYGPLDNKDPWTPEYVIQEPEFDRDMVVMSH